MEEKSIVDKLETYPEGKKEIETPVEALVVETPIVEAVKHKGLNALVVFAALAVVLVAAGSTLGYYAWKDSESQTTDVGEMETEVEETVMEEDAVKWTDWKGEYLSAKLPEGWSIEESIDNEDPAGLLEVSISDDLDTMLVKMKSYIHLGGGINCDTDFIKFDDYDPGYLKLFEDRRLELECEGDLVIHEPEDYVELELLGNTLRRVDGEYFSDGDLADEYFQPGFVGSTIVNTELPSDYLFMSYVEQVKEDELRLLDQVLESFEVVEQEDSAEGTFDPYEGWRDYSNEAFGITLKLPDGYATEEFVGKIRICHDNIMDSTEADYEELDHKLEIYSNRDFIDNLGSLVNNGVIGQVEIDGEPYDITEYEFSEGVPNEGGDLEVNSTIERIILLPQNMLVRIGIQESYVEDSDTEKKTYAEQPTEEEVKTATLIIESIKFN